MRPRHRELRINSTSCRAIEEGLKSLVSWAKTVRMQYWREVRPKSPAISYSRRQQMYVIESGRRRTPQTDGRTDGRTINAALRIVSKKMQTDRKTRGTSTQLVHRTVSSAVTCPPATHARTCLKIPSTLCCSDYTSIALVKSPPRPLSHCLLTRSSSKTQKRHADVATADQAVQTST